MFFCCAAIVPTEPLDGNMMSAVCVHPENLHYCSGVIFQWDGCYNIANLQDGLSPCVKFSHCSTRSNVGSLSTVKVPLVHSIVADFPGSRMPTVLVFPKPTTSPTRVDGSQGSKQRAAIRTKSPTLIVTGNDSPSFSHPKLLRSTVWRSGGYRLVPRLPLLPLPSWRNCEAP